MSSVGTSLALPAPGPHAHSQMGTLAVVCTAVFFAVLTGTGAVKRAEEYPEGDTRRGDPRYQGDLMGIAPTGRHVRFTGMIITRFVGGQVIEDWDMMDMLGLLQQLGVIPAPGQATS